MMEGALLELASAAWASMSALAVLLLGFLALGGGRARAPGSAAFAAFAGSWAAHVLAGHWMSHATLGFAPRAHLIYLAFLLPLPYFLVQFARSFAPDGLRRGAWRLAAFVSAGLPLVVIGALLLAPELVYGGPMLFNGRVFPSWGPLFAPLAIFPFFLALGLTLHALDAARRASPTARPALRHALLAGGLAAYTAFSAGNNLTFYLADLLHGGSLPAAAPYVALFGAITALCLLIGWRAAREALRAPSQKTRRPAAIVAAATLAPLVLGSVEGVVAYLLLPRFNSVGLWRLAGVALIAYALARSRIPDLAPRSRHTVATALGVAAAATLGGLAIGAFMLFAPGAPLILLAATAIPLAALSPSVRLARRALHVRPQPDLSDATLARRVDTYRAALESALARGSLADDEPFLAGLRHDLAITPEVHEALLCIARENVLPAPHATHPGYERLRLLGEGAHGRAWLARRRADDELVVIKEPREQDATSRSALARQAQDALRVRHPRVVAIRQAVEAPTGSFLVMDHMPGGSLADLLARGPLPAETAIRHTLEVLDGLHALHRARLTHGDVKPANVLLDAEGRACVADFDLTRPHAIDTTMTMLGAQGTLATMAPEQLDGARPTPAADIYATGALLYRLLTGEHYVSLSGVDETRARASILDAPPRLPHPRVPAALEPVLARALAKRPAERYADARAMSAALEEAGSRL